MSARSPRSSSRWPAVGDLGVAALAGEPVALAAGEHVDGLADEGALGVVVRAAGPPRPGTGLRDQVAVELDGLALDAQPDRVPRQLLAVADRGGEHLGHVERPLARRGRGGLRAAGREPRVELPDRREQHARLAERGQHLLDVAQERRVRADDEHAALRQLAAVGVEQVGRAVQRHRGLAGPGPALDDEHAVHPGPDDPVLLGLDGRDDVAHAPGAPGAQRGEQRGLAGESAALGAVAVWPLLLRRRRGRGSRRRRRGPCGCGYAGGGAGGCRPGWRPSRCSTAGPPGRASR